LFAAGSAAVSLPLTWLMPPPLLWDTTAIGKCRSCRVGRWPWRAMFARCSTTTPPARWRAGCRCSA